MLKRSGNNQGFTLIEIMVALALVAFLLGIATTGSFSSRKSLDEALNSIERSVRFSADEAALRNTIVRVHIEFGDEEDKYSVEYGPTGDFVIRKYKDLSNLSGSDEKKELEKQKKQNSEFTRVEEFSESAEALPYGVRVVGVGTGLIEAFTYEKTASTYIYPSGEKDSAIIILATDEEIATLVIDPFTMDIKRTYHKLEDSSEEMEEVWQSKGLELYQEWLKKK